MRNPIPLSRDVFWLGVNDRETDLFEALWPLPQGISYNAYMVAGEKVALIDTVKRNYLSLYLEKIRKALKGDATVDYLVINHMEPDHSGSIKVLSEIFPEMKIVGNKKTKEFLEGYYSVTGNVTLIEDGDVLDLGGRKLKFILTPMVHWPETMMSYDEKDKILFSGDAFGGFGALNGGLFDDEVDVSYYEYETLRYFANIVGKFSPMVQKAIEKARAVDIGVIASTHGPVWRKNPHHILDRYDRWSRHETDIGVTIVYGSMYTNTQLMAETVARALAENGIEEIRMHNSSHSHLSYILTDAWKYRGLILGSCTYDVRLFPPMAQAVSLLEDKSLKNRNLGIFGSYGWSGGAVKQLKEFAERGKWAVIEPIVEAKCAPSEKLLDQCATLGKNMAQTLRGQQTGAY